MATTFIYHIPAGYELKQWRDFLRLRTCFQLGENPEAILQINDERFITASSFREICEEVQGWIDRVVAYESGKTSVLTPNT